VFHIAEFVEGQKLEKKKGDLDLVKKGYLYNGTITRGTRGEAGIKNPPSTRHQKRILDFSCSLLPWPVIFVFFTHTYHIFYRTAEIVETNEGTQEVGGTQQGGQEKRRA
jgi:hypothetical protein